MSNQEATAAAIGGIVVPRAFEDALLASAAKHEAEAWDWRTYAAERHVTVVQLVASFARTWPKTDQWARPSRSRDFDRLAADPTMAPVLRAEIDECAR